MDRIDNLTKRLETTLEIVMDISRKQKKELEELLDRIEELEDASERLAENDHLVNAAAHFFKSGNIIRGKESDQIAVLKDLLPKNGPNGTELSTIFGMI